MLNEGKPPFEVSPERGSKLGKNGVSKLNRKYYGEVGLKSQLNKPCEVCGRRIACNHRSYTKGDTPYIPNKPVLLIEYQKCTQCGTDIDKTHTICPSCNFLDPFKDRSKEAVN